MTIINKDILGPNVIYKKVKLKGTREVAEIYDNCLDQHVFQDIQNKIFYQNFPWYLEADDRSYQGYHKSPLKNYEITNHTQFNHLFYHVNDRASWSNYTPWINPVLNIINPRAWFRVKANYVASSHKSNIIRGWHHDACGDMKNTHNKGWPECKIAVLYINTNNGYTEFKNINDCHEMQNEIDEDFKEIFKESNRRIDIIKYRDSGNSSTKQIVYDLLSGSVVIDCIDWDQSFSETSDRSDWLNVAIDEKEYRDWLISSS